MSNYKQELISSFVDKITASGYRAFVAQSGEYGFYTDSEGTKVVCFQTDFSSITLSGNYKTSNPKQTGNGWRISDSASGEDINSAFNAYPPQWAVRDATWKYTTLEQHLATYQKSSKYEEVEK